MAKRSNSKFVGGEEEGAALLALLTGPTSNSEHDVSEEPRDKAGRWTKGGDGSLSAMLGLLGRGKKPASDVKQSIADQLSAVPGVPDGVRDKSAKHLRSCLKNCSAAALQRVDAHVSSLKVHDGTRSVDKAFEDATQAEVNYTQGFYLVTSRRLEYDGSSKDAKETLAHELGHAIDGPRYEYSKSEEWKEAYKTEIDKAGDPLSAYARTKPCEGFAEYARLVLTGRLEEAKRFPRCFAFWQERGLIK